MGEVRDFDGRWVGEGGGGPKDSQHGPFWRMSALFGTRDRLCICPLFVSISD